MKLAKILLATTLTVTAFSTFAATAKEKALSEKEQAALIESQEKNASEKVIVSTQEQPVTPDQAIIENSAAGQPTTAQPTTESAATEGSAPVTPEANQPVQ